MISREGVRIRILPEHEAGDRRDVADFTPVERMAMMWRLACNLWAFKGEAVDESRLQRHLVPGSSWPALSS